MPLRPHLHLLVPSASAGVQLEARIYALPAIQSRLASRQLPLVDSVRSQPIDMSELSTDQLELFKAWRIDRLIIGAHPWQKLGGNMLDPVLSDSLVEAIHHNSSVNTVLVTFNARGVGRSGGSMGLLGLSTTTNEKDFGAVERFFVGLFIPSEIWRVGYSWGSIAALNAAKSQSIHSTLLVSPPSSLFAVTSLFSSRTFSSALTQAGKVRIVHGTQDQFTSVTTYQALQKEEVKCWEIEGADHFYRDKHSSDLLRQRMSDWLKEP